IGVVIFVVVESQDFVYCSFVDGIDRLPPLVTVLKEGLSFLEIAFNQAIDVTLCTVQLKSSSFLLPLVSTSFLMISYLSSSVMFNSTFLTRLTSFSNSTNEVVFQSRDIFPLLLVRHYRFSTT